MKTLQFVAKAVIVLSALSFASFAAIGAEGPDIQFLKAQVDVEVNNGIYSYTIRNDEPAHSVYAFHLDIKDTPVTIVGWPPRWTIQTDSKTFVFWLTLDEASAVPPGRSLDGFQIQSPAADSTSTAYSLTGWGRSGPKAHLATVGSVLSPLE